MFENFDLSSIDIDDDTLEMISKIMNIMSSLKNQNDNRCDLLYAIKPHLSGKRADEIETCVKFLKISTILSALNKKEEKEKNDT